MLRIKKVLSSWCNNSLSVHYLELIHFLNWNPNKYLTFTVSHILIDNFSKFPWIITQTFAFAFSFYCEGTSHQTIHFTLKDIREIFRLITVKFSGKRYNHDHRDVFCTHLNIYDRAVRRKLFLQKSSIIDV